MTLETSKEKIIYQGVVPIIAAVIGAMAATWFQSASIDQAQLADVIMLLKDPTLTADQKLQALKIYEKITDRPWAVIRSLAGTATFAVTVAVGAMVAGGYFMRQDK